jgi:hypothetical protein
VLLLVLLLLVPLFWMRTILLWVSLAAPG